MIMSEEQECEPIVGYRTHWIFTFPNYLTSGNLVYEPRKRAEAICQIDPTHAAPVENCTCGIYAYKREEFEKQRELWHGQVFGEIYLWGKVVEHKKGYRAQYAYPKSLKVDINDKLGPYIGWMALLYGVPIELVEKPHTSNKDEPKPPSYTPLTLNDLRLLAFGDCFPIDARKSARTQLRARQNFTLKNALRTKANLEETLAKKVEQCQLLTSEVKALDDLLTQWKGQRR
jgi:hypothetical protein